MNTVTKEVHIREFDTETLLVDLYNRIDDYINDPEPQYDPFIEEMTGSERLDLKNEIGKLVG